jgi:AcrR family transcriptional regulator
VNPRSQRARPVREKLATEVRREQIVAAALALISERGPRGFSLAAVARHLGLVPSALYRHFRNKEEIIEAVLEFAGARLLANARAAEQESPDALEQLQSIALLHARFIRENHAIPHIVFSEVLAAGHPERKAQLARLVRAYLEAIADIVRRGQRDGVIRTDVDPASAAVLLLGLVQPAAFLWFISDGRFDVTRHVRNGWRLYEAAMLKD